MKLAALTFFLLAASAINCQTTTVTVGTINNSGPCSVTVINPKASNFRITGCGIGNQPATEQAKQLKAILSLAKQNGVTLQQILEAVQKLPAQTSRPVVQQSVGEGIINNSPVTAPQTFNDQRQYSASKPTPQIINLRVEPLEGFPINRPENMNDADWQTMQVKISDQTFAEPRGWTQNPGIALTFTVDRMFAPAMFVVKCDHRCIGTAQYQEGTGTAISGQGTPNRIYPARDHEGWLLFQFGSIGTLMPGQYVTLKVRSTDSREVSATVEAYEQ